MVTKTSHLKNRKQSLPVDCLDEIFKQIEYDNVSLYSCLRVNRLWCRQIVPLLWQCPFKLIKINTSDSLLIRTLVNCLSDDERSSLRIRLPKRHSYTLFDYPRFITEIEYLKLNLAVRWWYSSRSKKKHSNPFSSHYYNGRKLTFQLLSMILSRCQKVVRFDLEKSRETFLIPEFTRFKGALSALSHLRKFHMSSYPTYYEEEEKRNITQIFKVMKGACRDIRYLNINIDGFNFEMENSLIELISSQSRIEHVILEAYSANPMAFILALQNQSETLTRLEFKWSYLNQDLIKALAVCSNIDTMVFIECSNMTTETWSPLIEEDQQRLKLKKLYFMNEENTDVTSPYDCSPIIQMAGENLTHLVIYVYDCLPTLFPTIAEFCPNLVSLGIFVDDKTINFIPEIFENCCQIRQLALRLYRGKLDSDKVLSLLTPSTPANIQEFNMYFRVSSEYLAEFLRNTKAPLTRIGMRDPADNWNEHLRLLIEYAKRTGHLKKVGFGTDVVNTSQFDRQLVKEAEGIIEFVPNLWFDMYGDYGEEVSF